MFTKKEGEDESASFSQNLMILWSFFSLLKVFLYLLFPVGIHLVAVSHTAYGFADDRIIESFYTFKIPVEHQPLYGDGHAAEKVIEALGVRS